MLLDLPLSRDYFLSLFECAGLHPQIAERTVDMGILRSMVANGYGYALANIRPKSGVAPDGKPLRFVKLSGGYRAMIMGLVTPGARHKTRTLLAFEKHCRATISTQTIPGLETPNASAIDLR